MRVLKERLKGLLKSLRQNWPGYSVSLFGVAFMTVFYKAILTDVYAATVALSFLPAVGQGRVFLSPSRSSRKSLKSVRCR